MTDTQAFDPSRHLSSVNGNAYLEVKWRLVWLRSEYPRSQIETELVSYANNEAIFHASITTIDADGQIVGTGSGYGSEEAQSFGDFLEKAETKALGRALATLGFGTQFCTDFDMPDRSRPPRSASSSDAPANQGSSLDPVAMTPAQRSKIEAMVRNAKLSPQDVAAFIESSIGTRKKFAELTKREASQMIDALTANFPQ